MTRRDLVRAISPGRTGTDKSKWDPDELSRPRAEAVVNVTFDSIAAALKKGEKVTLPIGTFEVLDRKRPPLRRWLLGRVRVTYVQRKVIQFTPAEGWLEEPAGGGKGPAAVGWRAKYLARQKARK
jgi:nucleoid DNA-binding protein